MLNFIKNLFQKEGHSQEEVEELRTLFKARYHNFKLLLNANNKALEIMSDIEEVLTEGVLFDMSFIRAKSTGALVNVLKIIKNLDGLAPDKYGELYKIFESIQSEIERLLRRPEPDTRHDIVIFLDEVDLDMGHIVGGKMAGIGEVIKKTPYNGPQGFAITKTASDLFFHKNDLQTEIDRRIQAADRERVDSLFKLSSDLQHLVIDAPMPHEVETAIIDAYKRLEEGVGKGVRVSMRSSAIGEDMLSVSFAGQYNSRLNVTGEELIQAYKEILSSKYSLTAITYRQNKGIKDEDAAMCVGCMVMIDAASGGVAYSRNPLDKNDRSIIVDSVFGLPKTVVDGSLSPDIFMFSRETFALTKKTIQTKPYKLVTDSRVGLVKIELDEQTGNMESISEERAAAIAHMVYELERHYGVPVDMEWAVNGDGEIIVLQCRPLQMVHSEPSVQSLDVGETPLLSGTVTASPGAAFGPVFIVEKNADVLLFPDYSVLVVRQSLPRWAVLLGRACAVIAEQGGVVGHLATVCREYDIPALFNVPDAVKRLKNGDIVTVDADGQKVYPGCIESLIIRREHAGHPMEGTSVYELLYWLSRKVTPLNLTDPDGMEFRPSGCKTLHDITRYCHERAVIEMFDFGKSHHFSERSSKQIRHNRVALKWWVINLDDGFDHDAAGKYVELENIISIPFRYIWDGMVAIPWAGPPSIDAKGFMSIIHQATSNPDLDPSMSSQYTNKNYFLVSKNYCSLTSRFGFHFATVEALLGERTAENYTGFNFRGGATDLFRRSARAAFVSELLEEFGFGIRLKDDSLSARVEGLPLEVMQNKLKIIGYLLMHTRQLDMIMHNASLVNEYRERMTREMHSIHS